MSAYGCAVRLCDAWAAHLGVPWDVALDAVQEIASDAIARWSFIPSAEQILHFAYRNLRGYWRWKSVHAPWSALGEEPVHEEQRDFDSDELDDALVRLSEEERGLFGEIAEGRTLRAIAKDRGVDHKTIFKRLRRASRAVYFASA